MRVYFVIDLMEGRVVRAYRGERERYRSIAEFSRIVTTDDPLDVLSVVRPRRVYVADLDRILGRGDNGKVLREIASRWETVADCGFRRAEELEGLNFTPVLGTETFDLREIGNVKAFVSLDVFEGKPLSNLGLNLREIVEYLNSFDLLGVIVLTLDRVGSGSLDLDTLGKVLDLSENPVLAGGGVGSYDDLLKLKDMGCDGALIATAVHLGKVGLDVVRKGLI